MKKIILIGLFIPFLSLNGMISHQNTSQSNPTSYTFDQNRLDVIALEQGHGFKTANMIMLSELISLINQKNLKIYSYAVPTFASIASDKIQSFMHDNGLFFLDRWNDLINEFYPDEKSKNHALKTKVFSKRFLSALHVLEKDIETLFSNVAQSIDNDIIFNELFNIHPETTYDHIDSFIATAMLNNDVLMIRSSGQEDTEHLSNAGGNKSLKHITLDKKDIVKAIGEVIASYVSMHSLSQRLSSKDPNIFDIPLTPVLLQVMIKEFHESTINTCGVMYTHDPEVMLSSEHYDSNSSSITVIQSSYGHNEGVVESLVPCDTFYIQSNSNKSDNKKKKNTTQIESIDILTRLVSSINLCADALENIEHSLDKQPLISSLIRVKNQSLVTMPGGGTHYHANTLSLANLPSLNYNALYALKIGADIIQNYYHKPMDVEFVIDQSNKIIYLVQARPVVCFNHKQAPSYVHNLNDSFFTQLAKGETITAGGSFVRLIDDRNKVIFATHIEDARKQYYMSTKQQEIQCVIVDEYPALSSHAIAEFRSKGIPVFYVNDTKTIKNLLRNPDTYALLDPQQNVMLEYANNYAPDDYIQIGWVNYPKPKKLSLRNPENNEITKSFSDVKNAILEKIIPSNMDDYSTLTQLTLQEIITSLKKDDENDARIALYLLIRKIKDTTDYFIKQHYTHDEFYLKKTSLLEHHTAVWAEQLNELVHYDKDHPHYVSRLFAIQMLETAIYQHKSHAINTESYSYIWHELNTINDIISLYEKRGFSLTPETALYLLEGKKIFDQKVSENWIEFTIGLQDLDENIKNKFAALMTILGQLDIVSLWLNSSFARTYRGNIEKTLIKLFNEIDQSKDFLQTLGKQKNKLSSYDYLVFKQANLTTFVKHYFDFNEILAYFFSDQFKNDYNNAQSIAQLIMLQTMSDVIETFDLAIKSIRSSEKYTCDADRFQPMHVMIIRYFELLEYWLSFLSQKDTNKLFGGNNGAETFFERFKTIKKRLIYNGLNRNRLNTCEYTFAVKDQYGIEQKIDQFESTLYSCLKNIGSIMFLTEPTNLNYQPFISYNKLTNLIQDHDASGLYQEQLISLGEHIKLLIQEMRKYDYSKDRRKNDDYESLQVFLVKFLYCLQLYFTHNVDLNDDSKLLHSASINRFDQGKIAKKYLDDDKTIKDYCDIFIMNIVNNTKPFVSKYEVECCWNFIKQSYQKFTLKRFLEDNKELKTKLDTIFAQFNTLLSEVESHSNTIGNSFDSNNFENISFLHALHAHVGPPSRKTYEDLLLLSNKFNVATTTLSANVKNEHYTQPWSLEDIYTYIHQNLLDFIGFNYAKYRSKTIATPRCIKNLLKQIARVNYSSVSLAYKNDSYRAHRPQLILVAIESKTLSYTYNFLLNGHSMKVILSYDKTTGLADITINLFGRGLDEPSAIPDLCRYIAQKHSIEVVQTLIETNQTIITLRLDPNEQSLPLQHYIPILIQSTEVKAPLPQGTKEIPHGKISFEQHAQLVQDMLYQCKKDIDNTH